MNVTGGAEMHEVAWARLKESFRNNPCLNPGLASRKWWPVYVQAHRDPELGGDGPYLHHHIAWNRLSEKSQNRCLNCVWGYDLYSGPRTRLAALVLRSSEIDIWNYKRPTPIIGPPIVPKLSKEFMIQTWRRWGGYVNLEKRGKVRDVKTV